MRNIVFIVIAFVLLSRDVYVPEIPFIQTTPCAMMRRNCWWSGWMLCWPTNAKAASVARRGILCPACARIHGRIGDTVLPLMYLADKTGNDKYLLAAKKLMKWMENVHRPDAPG